MTQGCLFMSYGPIPLLALISLFLQLLSAYYASDVLLGMFIFFFFPVCYHHFIAWRSLVFHHMGYSGKHDISLHHNQMLRYRKFSVVWIKLWKRKWKQERLWEQEFVSDCFDNFTVFSQTCTIYRKTASSSCSFIIISWVSFLPDYRIYSCFGAHHLSVSQVAVKQNIRQWKNWTEKFKISKARKLCI